MRIDELRDELTDEISTILADDFDVEVTGTSTVPHSNDPSITFPNLDAGKLSTKLLESCVLYVDIRRSTELNLTHRPKTVSKLYSAFVRAMTRSARQFGGHVRGIIGDRVMVLFDAQDAYANAVNTAVLMNSVAKHVLNKHFKRGEMSCGIGIDAGKMLVTKTGFRRHGAEQHNYKNLVWLGRPANVASKLTDLANKSSETVWPTSVSVAYGRTGPMPTEEWTWVDEWPHDFVQQLEPTGYPHNVIRHKDARYATHILGTRPFTQSAHTPPILMTEIVWEGFKRAEPNDQIVTNGWAYEVPVDIAGYNGKVFGTDTLFTVFQR